jgi:hypothetical protein
MTDSPPPQNFKIKLAAQHLEVNMRSERVDVINTTAANSFRAPLSIVGST